MATIRDVANRAKVSIATVSNVLNAKDERVSAETKHRVLAAIRELKYRPTVAESSQKAMQSKTIATIAPDSTRGPLSRHQYFSIVLDGIVEVSFFHAWNVILSAMRTWDSDGSHIRHQFDGRCDGVILVAPQPYHDMVGLLQERGTKMVQIGSTPWLSGVSCVDLDNHAAGRVIGEHFLELGHRRIGFISEGIPHICSHERKAGLAAAIAPLVLQEFHKTNENSYDAIAAEIKRRPSKHRPTALLGWHDQTARDMVAALLQAGVDVPGEVSVAGIDGDAHRSAFDIPVTSVENPLFEIGKCAANLIIEPKEDISFVKFPAQLMIQATTGPVKKE